MPGLAGRGVSTAVDGYWTVTLQGYPPVDTQDLTLDEIEAAEKACGVPYTLMDPRESVRIARALFVVCMVRGGMDEDKALKAAGQLRLAVLHGAFTWQRLERSQPPQVLAAAGDETGPPSSAATSGRG